MDKKIIPIVLITLIIGFGIGYVSNTSKKLSTDPYTMSGSSMKNTMTGMTGALKGKTGEVLEIAFLEGMIVHHEGAVAMAKELQSGTKRPELLKMADDIISVQTSEINMMKGWLNQWFGR